MKALLIIVSEDERDLIDRRCEAIVRSLDASKRRHNEAKAVEAAAHAQYHEALLALAEDEDDDFNTAREKAEKMERIEQEFIDAPVRTEKALLRLGWDAVQARNAGIIK